MPSTPTRGHGKKERARRKTSSNNGPTVPTPAESSTPQEGERRIFKLPSSIVNEPFQDYDGAEFEILKAFPDQDTYAIAPVDEDGIVQRGEKIIVGSRHLGPRQTPEPIIRPGRGPISDTASQQLERLTNAQRDMLSIGFPSGSILTAVVVSDEDSSGPDPTLYVISDGREDEACKVTASGKVVPTSALPDGEKFTVDLDWLVFQSM
jgi:hypothetical protein